MVSCRRHDCTEICAAFFRFSFGFFLAIRIHNDECIVDTHTKDNEQTVQVKQAHISLLEDKGVEQDCWAEGKHDHCNYTYTEENRFSGEGYVGQHEQDGRRDPHCVSWDVVSNVLLQEWASVLHTIRVKGHLETFGILVLIHQQVVVRVKNPLHDVIRSLIAPFVSSEARPCRVYIRQREAKEEQRVH